MIRAFLATESAEANRPNKANKDWAGVTSQVAVVLDGLAVKYQTMIRGVVLGVVLRSATA